MNVNRGQKILLRLRHSEQRGGGFLQYDSVLGTMLHELSHNRHSNHSADFYRLLDTLTDECAQLIREGITGQCSDHRSTMRSVCVLIFISMPMVIHGDRRQEHALAG